MDILKKSKNDVSSVILTNETFEIQKVMQTESGLNFKHFGKTS